MIAVIYSITENTRANGLNVYDFIRHLLTELPQLIDENGSIEQFMLEHRPCKDMSDLSSCDYSSRCRDIAIGDIAVWKNKNGLFIVK